MGESHHMYESYVESTEDDVVAILARVEGVLGGRYVSTVEAPSPGGSLRI